MVARNSFINLARLGHTHVCMLMVLIVFVGGYESASSMFLVRVKDDKGHPEGQTHIMVNEKKRVWRRINDTYTFKFLWHEALDNLKIIDSTVKEFEEKWGEAKSGYKEGPSIASLVHKSPNPTPDDIIEAYSTKMRILQDNDNLIKTYWWTGSIWNPSIAPFRNRFLACYRELKGNSLVLGWAKKEKYFFVESDDSANAYLGIRKASVSGVNLPFGADCRVVVVNDSFVQLSFAITPEKYYPTRMASIDLVVKTKTVPSGTTTNASQVEEVAVLENYRDIMPSFDGPDWKKTFYKNWMPFWYNETMVFVHSIDPFVTVRVVASKAENGEGGGNKEAFDAKIFSVSEAHEHAVRSWNHHWGVRHGGSSPLKISTNQYLTFFHSRRELPGMLTTTYFMGAYTFSTEFPFKVTSVSRAPLYHENFYHGAWDLIKNFDYVVFPMSFFFENGVKEITHPCDMQCLQKTNITLSLGTQDKFGFALLINLGELMETMVKV